MYTKREVKEFIARSTKLHKASDPLNSIYLMAKTAPIYEGGDEIGEVELYDREDHMHDRALTDMGSFMGDDDDDDLPDAARA